MYVYTLYMYIHVCMYVCTTFNSWTTTINSGHTKRMFYIIVVSQTRMYGISCLSLFMVEKETNAFIIYNTL